MSTVSGVYSMGSVVTEIPTMDVKVEQPYQSHPVSSLRAMPRYDVTSGPSDAVEDMKGTKRKRSRLSQDQRYARAFFILSPSSGCTGTHLRVKVTTHQSGPTGVAAVTWLGTSRPLPAYCHSPPPATTRLPSQP